MNRYPPVATVDPKEKPVGGIPAPWRSSSAGSCMICDQWPPSAKASPDRIRKTILLGAATAIDLSGVLASRRIDKVLKAGRIGTTGDWEKVGSDIWRVLKTPKAWTPEK